MLMKYFKIIKLMKFIIFIIGLITTIFIFLETIDSHKNNNINVHDKDLIQIVDTNYSYNLPGKWIVITTILKPTNDIQKMAETDNWKIVIVADQKTPKNWTYKNCIFLSVEMQRKLKYKILPLVPYNSYTRKLIGYLYAIENGAKFIYDTDDDNLPQNLGLKLFDYSNITSGLIRYETQPSGKPHFFNVYSHFGRSDIWPRGYPLELINQEIQTSCQLCRQIQTPIIQQGLVNQDADVDAVYRMIFVKNETNGLNVNFDTAAPPIILDKNIYCPFNSQNTLFHYKAFWALLLPTTVSFRVTDIWRGYWAQRLLHLIGNYLGFYGPNARQVRNPHSYFRDFLEEQQLYTDSASLVQTIQQWQCNSTDFSLCIIRLSEFMVQKKFWKRKDLRLTEAWINDLKTVGYRFPELHTMIPNPITCVFADFISTAQTETQIESVHMNILTKLNNLCYPLTSTKFYSTGNVNSSLDHMKKVVLIIIINTQHFSQIPLLQLLYNPWFANVIFCSSFPSNVAQILIRSSLFKDINPDPKFSFINVPAEDWQDGFFGYICLNKVIDMKILNVDGYMTIADDMIFHFWNSFNTKKVSYSSSTCVINDKWYWWTTKYGTKAVENLSNYLKFYPFSNENREIYVVLKEILTKRVFCGADIYYVPSNLLDKYQFLSQLFFNHKVFLEIAVPRILYSLGWASNVSFDETMQFNNSDTVMKGKYFWQYQDRSEVYKFYDETDIFLHPIKMSFFDEQSDYLKLFCNTYLKTMMRALYEH